MALADVDGEVLVVSQFTLFADCRHGRRHRLRMPAPRCRQRALRVLPDACSSDVEHVAHGIFGADESRLGQRRSIHHRPGHRQPLGYAVLPNRVTTGHARLSSGTYLEPGLFSYLRMATTGCYSIRVLSILGVLSPF
ncbi:MAG: D-aminoacyl-tRNA deacylase [Collinsella aerofaciens]